MDARAVRPFTWVRHFNSAIREIVYVNDENISNLL